ncbi:MAG: DUF4846 domain-containing protein [Flavobacteriales bacterium]
MVPLLFFIGSWWACIAPKPSETIVSRFVVPPRYVRLHAAPDSFASWLRTRALLPMGSPVLLYNGEPKSRQDVHAAVLDISVGAKDLQQCADAVMRLRAEYLFAQGRSNEIQFNFTNGFTAEFRRWKNGERIKVVGNQCSWSASARPDSSHATLLAYLDRVFTYAGTSSLSKELRPAGGAGIEPGDVFIQGGSPGHAVIVVDVAMNSTGKRVFLLAQSYMPAQSIHILKNVQEPALGSWFLQGEGDRLRTPEWTFDWSDRKRW